MIYKEGEGPDNLVRKSKTIDQRDLEVLRHALKSSRPNSASVHQHSHLNPEARKLRWIHLLANKLSLMRDLVTRLSHDSNRPEMEHRALMKHFNRSWTELAAGGGRHYMKPQCMIDRSNHLNNDEDVLSKNHSPRIALYMPFLTIDNIDTIQCRETSGHRSTSFHGRDSVLGLSKGLDESINSRDSRNISHKRMTLDQYYYPVITDTMERDKDQVLSKFLEKKRDAAVQDNNPNSRSPRSDRYRDPQNPVKEILVVDQLWLWIIEETTIITATTEMLSSDQESPSSLLQTVLNSIIYGNSKSQFERPTSVHEMMELILGVATGFFVKRFVPVPGAGVSWKGALDVFRESIRYVVNGESSLFKSFLDDLGHEIQEQDRVEESEEQSESKPFHKPVSIREIPRNKYHIISRETDFLTMIRDIRDELHMLKSLAEDQDVVWKQAFPDGFQYYHHCTPTDVKKELDEMLLEADMTNDSINTLLDLRQKQASLKEAEFARIQANDTARQSNSVFIFTLMTVVFLPLSFLSSLFALDISNFPHESGNLKYKGWWLFPILFGVSVIVSIPAIVFACKVDAIAAWFRPRRRDRLANVRRVQTQEEASKKQDILGILRRRLDQRRKSRESFDSWHHSV